MLGNSIESMNWEILSTNEYDIVWREDTATAHAGSQEKLDLVPYIYIDVNGAHIIRCCLLPPSYERLQPTYVW